MSFENLREQKLNGKVTSIYPKDGQFFVNIEVQDMPAEVLVGMTADVAIQVAKKDNVLQVPLVAVRQGSAFQSPPKRPFQNRSGQDRRRGWNLG